MDIETRESNDPYCFQVSKFNQLLGHNQEVHREAGGTVHFDQIIDECKKSNPTILDIGQTR